MDEGSEFTQQQHPHPRRISITLSFHVSEALLNRSFEEGRSLSNLCAYLIEEALIEQAQNEWQRRSVNKE
jgi:macrodomain Ter protein organizer (MatP/YcbG family)